MTSIPERLALVTRRHPQFASTLGDVARAQVQGPLDARTTRLIYLGALAALGADESFRLHLEEALGSGVTEEEALHAAVYTFTAAGITPILKVLDAFVRD